jgi:hypothetical protein
VLHERFHFYLVSDVQWGIHIASASHGKADETTTGSKLQSSRN